MSELQAFIAMLERAGIPHGKRTDYYPRGESVLVEHIDGDNEGEGFWVTDWGFDASGKLVQVAHYEGQEG